MAFHIVLPITVGGLLYVLWRDSNLLMFSWFRSLGILPLVAELRLAVASAKSVLPHWLTLSLPDALWVYAFTAFMIHIWRGVYSSPVKVFWISLGLLFGAGSELGQLAGIIPGTFDLSDLFFCVLGALAALLLTLPKPNLQGA